MRELSQTVISQIYSQDIDGVYTWLIEISHESLETLYLNNDNVDLVANGNTYTAFPFSVIPAKDGEDSLPQARLSFSNIGLDLVERIRSITTPLTINLKLVLSSDPTDVQVEIPTMKARGVSYDDDRIDYTLVYDDILSVSIPSYTYNPLEYGGLF